ncbi:uncharacterized protein LOC124273762 [Haliotis rubra]|uniref:uncharacterized protein LOC124273762 n=1 Tax=Haliotis rubra TaxID=36100 RepID=UPI001EE5C611|nr:uncharacterized protein LOC124273762 [Haliotis rubra]
MSHGSNYWMYIVGGCIGILLCSAVCFLVFRCGGRIRGSHQRRGGFRQSTPLPPVPPVPIPHDDLYDELDVGHSDTDSRPSGLDEAGNAHVDLSNMGDDKHNSDSLRVSVFGNVCPKFPGQETKSEMPHLQMTWLTETGPTAVDAKGPDKAASIDVTCDNTSTHLDEGLHFNPSYTSLGGRSRPSRNYLSPVEEYIKA